MDLYRETKDKTTAALLAIFLGSLGIHKFYLRRWVLGLVYLAFCWTFIPAIVGLVEGILLLVMSKRNFDLDYNPLSVAEFQQLAIAQAGFAQRPAANVGYPSHAKPALSRIEALQALQELRASGALSEAEFETEKNRVLASG